jgi:TonB family protein
VRKTGALLIAMTVVWAAGLGSTLLQGQEGQGEIVRRAKSKVPAVYPELARKMNITGTVKVEVVIAPNGSVKDAKVVGGHPVLANAALEAVKKWRFEPTALESSGVVDFKFAPRN